MLNFVADPKLLQPFVPCGTELDYDNDKTFLSVVGFLFLDTRLLGLPIPLHRDFEEVNLRFYVRKKSADTWRRGVVFMRELVPKRAIAIVARTFYGEPYLALPMKHEIEHVDLRLNVAYSWRRGRKWESLKMSAHGEPQTIAAGSHAEFITEHYWGYTSVRSGCSEYRVQHPRWRYGRRDGKFGDVRLLRISSSRHWPLPFPALSRRFAHSSAVIARLCSGSLWPRVIYETQSFFAVWRAITRSTHDGVPEGNWPPTIRTFDRGPGIVLSSFEELVGRPVEK